MRWLRLIQIGTIAIIAFYTVNFILHIANQIESGENIEQLTLSNKNWKMKISPFILLSVVLVATQLPGKDRWTLVILLVIICAFLPVAVFLKPIESLMIKLFHPKFTTVSSGDKSSHSKNNWDSVRLIKINSMLRQFIKNDVQYIGLVMIPELKIAVPLADYTNDAVYQFGAGMLQPGSLESDNHITIGAHNLGQYSNALFSQLARYQLYLEGMRVVVVSFNSIKEFEINRVEIIAETNVEAAMSGEKRTITLMTCTSDNRRRFLVRATLVKKYSLNVASETLSQRMLSMYKKRISHSSLRSV